MYNPSKNSYNYNSQIIPPEAWKGFRYIHINFRALNCKALNKFRSKRFLVNLKIIIEVLGKEILPQRNNPLYEDIDLVNLRIINESKRLRKRDYTVEKRFSL